MSDDWAWRYSRRVPTVVAHRGVKMRANENTAHALRDAALAGQALAAKGIAFGGESDFRRTRDGVLVVNHDGDRAGCLINGYTYGQLQAAMGERCPMRAEHAVALMADLSIANFELKEAGCSEEMVALALSKVKGRVLFSSFLADVASQLRAHVEESGLLASKPGDPRVETGWLARASDWRKPSGKLDLDALVTQWLATQTDTVILDCALLVHKELVDAIISEGGSVGTYTMNDAAELQRWMRGTGGRYGVDLLITDHPEYVHRELLSLFTPENGPEETWGDPFALKVDLKFLPRDPLSIDPVVAVNGSAPAARPA